MTAAGLARLALAAAAVSPGVLSASAHATVAGGGSSTVALVGGNVVAWGGSEDAGLARRGEEEELELDDLEDDAFDTVGDESDEVGANLPRLELRVAVTHVTAGHGFACAAALGGDAASAVMCWGSCVQGACGLGNDDGPVRADASLPFVDLGTAAGAVLDVQAGAGNHACALFEGGKIKCWGANDHGQLGYGDTADRGDEPGEMGDALPFVDLGSGVQAAQVRVGRRHTCALLASSGGIKCWGANSGGQLGLGAGVAGVGAELGQMGDGLPALHVGNARAIALRGDHVCALLEGGAGVKCWGSNEYGQLGYGDAVDRWTADDSLPEVDLGGARVAALAVGLLYTCALLDEGGALKCWGSNGFGQLGLGVAGEAVGREASEVPAKLGFVNVGSGNGEIEEVAAADAHTCVRLAGSDAVRCWGFNGFGQLGRGENAATWGTGPGQMGVGLLDVDISRTPPTVGPLVPPQVGDAGRANSGKAALVGASVGAGVLALVAVAAFVAIRRRGRDRRKDSQAQQPAATTAAGAGAAGAALAGSTTLAPFAH